MKVGISTLIAAIIATAGGVWVAYYNAKEQRELEREQFQSSLIQQSIDYKDYKQSRLNLKFLIDVGLLPEANTKINKFIKDTSVHFQRPIDKLPVPISSPVKPYKMGEFSDELITGIILDEITKRPIDNASVIIKTYHPRYINRPEPPSEAERMVTGRDGRFQVHKPWGDYFLYVNRTGYEGKKFDTLLKDLPNEQAITLERTKKSSGWLDSFFN